MHNDTLCMGRLASVAIVAAAMSISTIACGGQVASRELTATQSAQAVEALITWFECEECERGELAAVKQYGQAVVPNLIAVLNAGLSPAYREHMRRELEIRYDQLAVRARTDTNARLASSKDRFVALYLGNRDAQFRVRAAQALGAIGGQQARSALQAALGRPQRDDVQAVIRNTLATMR